MGPVAFEAIDAGTTRENALRCARVLQDAGLRFDLMDPAAEGRPHRLMIRTGDRAEATKLLLEAASVVSDPETPSTS